MLQVDYLCLVSRGTGGKDASKITPANPLSAVDLSEFV
jgi:hypothetical protein